MHGIVLAWSCLGSIPKVFGAKDRVLSCFKLYPISVKDCLALETKSRNLFNFFLNIEKCALFYANMD